MMKQDPQSIIKQQKAEIEELQRQLLWYRRTYEQRSLAGILFDRLFRTSGPLKMSKKGTSRPGSAVPDKMIRRASAASGIRSQTLCCVVNHNYNDNAVSLLQSLSRFVDTVLLDSGSEPKPPHSIRLPNIFYSGLLNNAAMIANNKQYKYLLFICSDVFITDEMAAGLAEALDSAELIGAGLFSPSSTGGSYDFCRQLDTGGYREVPFVEGYIFFADMRVINLLCPVDLSANRYGWGLDIAAGYFAGTMGLKCVISDKLVVRHTPGTGYSRETADLEMVTWISSLKDQGLAAFFETQMSSARL